MLEAPDMNKLAATARHYPNGCNATPRHTPGAFLTCGAVCRAIIPKPVALRRAAAVGAGTVQADPVTDLQWQAQGSSMSVAWHEFTHTRSPEVVPHKPGRRQGLGLKAVG